MGCLKQNITEYLMQIDATSSPLMQNRIGSKKCISNCKPLFKNCTGNYSLGFQGQESDSEVKGKGNFINFDYRIFDPRLGRFLSIDPLSSIFSYNSPYAFSENRLIDAIELEGLENISANSSVREAEYRSNISSVNAYKNSKVIRINNNSTIKPPNPTYETKEKLVVESSSPHNLNPQRSINNTNAIILEEQGKTLNLLMKYKSAYLEISEYNYNLEAKNLGNIPETSIEVKFTDKDEENAFNKDVEDWKTEFDTKYSTYIDNLQKPVLAKNATEEDKAKYKNDLLIYNANIIGSQLSVEMSMRKHPMKEIRDCLMLIGVSSSTTETTTVLPTLSQGNP